MFTKSTETTTQTKHKPVQSHWIMKRLVCHWEDPVVLWWSWAEPQREELGRILVVCVFHCCLSRTRGELEEKPQPSTLKYMQKLLDPTYNLFFWSFPSATWCSLAEASQTFPWNECSRKIHLDQCSGWLGSFQQPQAFGTLKFSSYCLILPSLAFRNSNSK